MSTSSSTPGPALKHSRASPRYKQKFRESWFSDPELRGWVQSVPGDPLKARCKLCQVLLTARKKDLKDHMKTRKHSGKQFTVLEVDSAMWPVTEFNDEEYIIANLIADSVSFQTVDRIGDGVVVSMNVAKMIIEGKTKQVYEVPDLPGLVWIISKDRITAGDGERADDMEGKAAISNRTTTLIYSFLNAVGVKTHFKRQEGETGFIARHCSMIPIEWVTRRIATGSFLKRNPGVKEGYRFSPPKLEIFYKDDANHDPQWSMDQLIAAEMEVAGVTIGVDEVEYMSQAAICVFEVLEKAWKSRECTLVDMKVEFGIDRETGDLLLADVIDSDSWRLWPYGDKKLMKDKQVYRDLKEVTEESLTEVKSNFAWVAEQLETFLEMPNSRVVIVMGSPADNIFCEKIKSACGDLDLVSELRVSSAHKGTTETLRILAEYESLGEPIVFIAVAGRSNGLGPVLAGNTSYPVINCPPISSDWGSEDIWSSLRLPTGLSCTTVLGPEGAAMAAAQILALQNHVLWARLRVKRLSNWIGLNKADRSVRP